MSMQAAIATAIFLAVYGLIIADKIHRTVLALLGTMLCILLGVFTQEKAVASIDFNTIGLLIGMMVIVGITKGTGVFEYLAIWAAKKVQGEPVAIMLSLASVTAFLSAFLDNVTTVLLIVPVTFSIAERLELSPLPFLMAETIASNIGGTATLIGDPPNIMIGSATGLGFMDFVIALAPIVIVVHIANMIWLKVLYRKELRCDENLKQAIMHLDENSQIKNPALLRKCLVVIGLTVLGFVLHQALHLDSALIAMTGATVLLFVTRIDPEEAFASVEWSVIFFFVGLFIIVGGLEHTGVIEKMAHAALALTGTNLQMAGSLILWFSAIASAFVDNIPFTATMIPLIKDMGHLGGIANLNPLWWALSLGACLGGNGTLIGASANIVVVGMAEKRGLEISFAYFFKMAFPMMLMTIAICQVYLSVFYFR
jgi:Na+/H+ antiporter NhaD/arsenite permease-like protein